jgi:hypothetical protein
MALDELDKPSQEELIDHINDLTKAVNKKLKVGDLPKQGILDWLEQDFKPNSDTFALPRSVGGPSLWSPPQCQVSRTTDTEFTAATWTAIPWLVENFDTDNIFSSAANTKLTARTDGVYYTFAQAAVEDAGVHYLRIRKNGNDAFNYGMQAESTADIRIRVSTSSFVRLKETDYLETMIYSSAAAPTLETNADTDITPRFGMVWIGNVPKGDKFDA